MSPKDVRLSEVKHHWEVYFFILPTLILIGLFQYYPAASGVFHSFFRWNGNDISEWVGLENYFDLAKSPEFWGSFKVALILGGWNILKMIPALLVAVCIHRCRSEKMQFLYRCLFVVPMVVPGLVIVLIWRSFFFEATAGYLNQFLDATGLMHVLGWLDTTFGWGGVVGPGMSPAWLGDPRLIIVACIVWGFPWVGSFAVLTHLAKLQGISKEIYEAAEVDGVNWWTKFWRIELPLLSSSIYLLLVFVIIETIKDAGTILALAGMEGGPGGKVAVPALFMLRKAFVEQKMGYACAVGIVLTITVLLLQKASSVIINWNQHTAQQRVRYRIALGLIAVVLFLSGAKLIGVVLLLAAMPWPRLFPARQPSQKSETATSRAAVHYGVAPDRTPEQLRRDRFTAMTLRFCKHATIWSVLAVAFLPLYLMLIVSGKTNDQFYSKPAAITFPFHWENWAVAWESITPTLANSMVISTTATVFTLIFALGAAYFFARLRLPLSGFLWNAVLILMMMPTIANLVPLFRLLGDLNLLNTLSALIIVGTSAGQVFAIFVLRSFIADIPQDLFEAAEIDGASHFLQLKLIVLPLSGPILGTVGVMRFLAEWNDFVLPLIVMRDHTRLPVMVALLRLAGEYIKYWGPLMAGYALASIPIIILFILSMKLFIRGLTEGATKG